MKKAFVVLGALIIFIAPLAVFAADTFLGPIVPEEFRSGNSGPYLQACDLVELFDRALQFAVYFATLVATIMIVYAGFLYVTASANQDNLNKAKSVFGNVFIGFVVVLVAWLVVNLIMGIFTNTDFRSWNKIECVEKVYQDQVYTTGGAIDSSLPGNPDAIGIEDTIRDTFYNAGVQVKDVSSTRVAGMNQPTIDYVVGIKQQCDSVSGNTCDVWVTGGTEGGHAGGTRPGSHGGGDKVDIRPTPSVRSYVDTQVKSGTFTKVAKPTFGSAQYIDTKTGAIWTDEGDHYDICVSNCKAPAAQGS